MGRFVEVLSHGWMGRAWVRGRQLDLICVLGVGWCEHQAGLVWVAAKHLFGLYKKICPQAFCPLSYCIGQQVTGIQIETSACFCMAAGVCLLVFFDAVLLSVWCNLANQATCF